MIFTQKTVLTCSLTLSACALCVAFIVSVKATAAQDSQIADMEVRSADIQAEMVDVQYTQGIRQLPRIDHAPKAGIAR